MSNKDIIGVFVTAYDRERLNATLKELTQTYPDSVSIMQYLVRNLPFRRIVNKQRNKHPQMKVLIIGNTNSNFGDLDDVRFLVSHADFPFSSYGIIDLRVGEEMGTEEDLVEAIAEIMEQSKININNALSEI